MEQILRLVINCVALVLIVVLCATIKLRENKIRKSVGSCLVPLEQKKSWMIYLIVFFCVVIVALQFFRKFQFYINVILDVVAILGVELSVKDFVLQKMSGVYENALIANSRLIPKNEIIALPTLEYEESEEYKVEMENAEFASDAYETAMKCLKVVTEKQGEFYIGFNSAEERKKSVEILRTWI